LSQAAAWQPDDYLHKVELQVEETHWGEGLLLGGQVDHQQALLMAPLDKGGQQAAAKTLSPEEIVEDHSTRELISHQKKVGQTVCCLVLAFFILLG